MDKSPLEWVLIYLVAFPAKAAPSKIAAYSQTFAASADIGLSEDGKFILVPDMKSGVLTWLPK